MTRNPKKPPRPRTADHERKISQASPPNAARVAFPATRDNEGLDVAPTTRSPRLLSDVEIAKLKLATELVSPKTMRKEDIDAEVRDVIAWARHVRISEMMLQMLLEGKLLPASFYLNGEMCFSVAGSSLSALRGAEGSTSP
ncbi:MAG: hypothetical protein ACYTG0_44430 [Planctomycetota bacterium]|jgi:hypothetical protein